MTPLKVKIIIALELSDTVVKDADVITVRPLSRSYNDINSYGPQIFKALHTAYRRSVANPMLRLKAPMDSATDHVTLLMAGHSEWKGFRRRVDEIGRAVGGAVPLANS